MKRALSVYQYAAPLVLAPLSFLLWKREYAGNLKLTATAWLIPILWAYIVPGIGTNVLNVWEFDTRLRLGRFRPHHGFVFGSATAMIAWLVHSSPARDLWDVARNALILCSVIGFWNLLYEVKALQSGILRVYNQPWADGRDETAIALDYAPWFFGGFGALYGAGIGLMEWLDGRGALSMPVFAAAFGLILVLTLTVPAGGYILQSIRRHGHWGTRPVKRSC
ncbi:MAG TPA: hypothetical protein VNN25_22275 [Thermoanaerobaculia bacterium]|nr:hypothetical protein [Thermoanaerobaculia bacterium]